MGENRYDYLIVQSDFSGDKYAAYLPYGNNVKEGDEVELEELRAKVLAVYDFEKEDSRTANMLRLIFGTINKVDNVIRITAVKWNE